MAISKKRHKNPWLKALKIFGIVIAALIIIAGVALWCVSSYFSPSRIAALIEEKSSEYLDAEIKIGALDYKLFKNYPWLYFEVDSLEVISKSLDSLPTSITDSLPADAAILASVTKLEGKIDLHHLLRQDIRLKDILIQHPKINIVIVNDSVNNFNIAPSLPKININKVPKIDISTIRMDAPLTFDFFSLQDDMEVAFNAESFYLLEGEKKCYDIGLEGDIKGRIGEYSLPHAIPLKFYTSLHPSFQEMALKLKSLSIDAAGVLAEINGDVMVKPGEIDLKGLDLHLKIEDLFSLVNYIPAQWAEKMVLPDGLTGILPLDITFSTLSPLIIDIENFKIPDLNSLPKAKTLVKVEDANLSITPPGGKKVDAEDIYFEAECNFNQENPGETDIIIKELRMHGEGISLDGKASAFNITGEQQKFDGDFKFHTPLIESIAYLWPKAPFKISGVINGDISFSGVAENLGKEGIKDIELKGEIDTRRLSVKGGTAQSMMINNMKSDFHAMIPSYPLTDYAGMKMVFDLSADSILAHAAGTKIKASNIDLQLDAMDTVSGSPVPYGDFKVKMKSMEAGGNGLQLQVNKIKLNAKGALKPPSIGNYNAVASTSGGDDALIASRSPHSPLVVEYDGGGILQTVMGMISITANLSIDKGEFKDSGYLLPVKWSNLDLDTDLNKYKISAENIGIGRSGLSLLTEIDGLLPFLTSYEATPLKAVADINFTNVDINQLSWGYYGALVKKGQDSVFFTPPMGPFTAADSLCIAIPRNIEADIKLHSNRAEYMQYEFSPLSTGIIVKNGNATLKGLTIGAPYCTAVIDWTYATSTLDNIYMDLKAKVEDFSFQPFYKVFPALTDKAREVENLTGVINADVDCKFGMFPDMFMNSASLSADFSIKGTEMQFARKGKIERITHLMLIDGDTPIKIQNLDITGSFHNNLLQINPFLFKFDDYSLSFAGINNTSGNMYYHIALEKSPFHLPFGVSLTGTFSHPEIKLGGTHIDDYESEKISLMPATMPAVNIMAYLRHGWELFIKEAAKYEENEK